MATVEFWGLNECAMAIADPLPAAFRAIAKGTRALLPSLNKAPAPPASATLARVRYLRACFAQDVCPQIDYDRYGMSFAYSYFMENYWKSAATFHQLQTPPARRIVDLGCGSGATALAYLTTLNAALGAGPAGRAKHTVWVQLLDRSQVQLRLAVDILQQAQRSLRHLDIRLEPLHLRLEEWEPAEAASDLVLLGHVLNENHGQAGPFLEKAVRAAREGGRICIIERKDDPIWPAVEACLGGWPLEARRGVISLATKGLNLPVGHPAREKAVLRTGYLELRIPEQKVLASLLELYFEAWQAQSVDLLERIFAPDAEYHEKPYDPPLLGLDAIRHYWQEKVLPQRDVHVQVIRFGYSHNDAFAEWEARFGLEGQRVRVNGMLVLTVDLQTRRVTALHEYFRSQGLQE